MQVWSIGVQGRLRRAVFPGDEVHSADQRSFVAKQAEGWEVVVEGESDSFHPTREEARVSIRAWKVKREAGTNASNLTEESFLAICKLLSLTPSVTLRRAVKARGVCIVPSMSRRSPQCRGPRHRLMPQDEAVPLVQP